MMMRERARGSVKVWITFRETAARQNSIQQRTDQKQKKRLKLSKLCLRSHTASELDTLRHRTKKKREASLTRYTFTYEGTGLIPSVMFAEPLKPRKQQQQHTLKHTDTEHHRTETVRAMIDDVEVAESKHQTRSGGRGGNNDDEAKFFNYLIPISHGSVRSEWGDTVRRRPSPQQLHVTQQQPVGAYKLKHPHTLCFFFLLCFFTLLLLLALTLVCVNFSLSTNSACLALGRHWSYL